MMSYLLLTGAEGLIGRALASHLTQSSIPFKPFDIRLPSNHPGAGDITHKSALSKALVGCIGIVHLAGTSRVITGEKKPELCWANNVTGTNNIIEAALQSPIKPWIIYASSREVYGQQEQLPVEEDTILKPMNVYAKSKVAAEKKIIEVRSAGLSTAILRFSNVFGCPFDYPDRVIPAFCRAALLGQPLRVEGSQNIFDFTFVEDVARGILEVIRILMSKPQNLPPIHFTTGRSITLFEAACTILKQANSASKMQEAAPRSFDVSRFYGSPRRAQKLLGWSARYSFEEAVDKFLLKLNSHIEGKNLLLERAAS